MVAYADNCQTYVGGIVLSTSWQLWVAKFSALNQRERWMVFFAGLMIIYFILNTLLVAPASQRHILMISEVSQARQQFAELQQQMTSLSDTPIQDVDAGNKVRIADLNAKVSAQLQELLALSDTLVSPELMPKLLENLMRKHADIRLVSMKTMPPVSFIQSLDVAATAEPQSANAQLISDMGVYQHGLEITVSGHYMALLHYAEALQGLSKQVLWDKADLAAKAYPASELTVTLYTLSLDKTWLSI